MRNIYQDLFGFKQILKSKKKLIWEMKD
jgi:hypothetical protein